MSKRQNLALKVLVVDDDPDQLLLRGLLIQQAGFEVVEAQNAGKALEAMAAHRPHCAVLDLCLPTEGAGLQLIADLKRRYPGLHIFVLTGNRPKLLESAPERALIDGVLLKGNSSKELMDRLRGLRQKASAAV